MASIKQALVTHLLADAGLSALVGTKIYPQFTSMSQTMPYIVFERDGEEVTENLSMISDINNESFSFFIYATTSLEVENIRVALKDAMALLNQLTVASVDFRRAFQDSSIDDFNTKNVGDEMPIYSESMSYTIWFKLL
jgi:hypothetical protein